MTGMTLHTDYSGTRRGLFKLALFTTLLTILTLGIYRFWAKTRIRKYIWSSTSAGGDNFEYTGTGMEKFLGFLVAVVVLAIYLGLVQVGLAYFGLSVFVAEPQTQAQIIAQLAAIYISFFAVVPLIFFAQYRARRYKLARTRWRGIRFGAEKGALGYVLRAIMFWILSVFSGFLLLPMQTFYLERYVTNRSWYGDGQFRQDGKWYKMFGATKHLYAGFVLAFVGGFFGSAFGMPALGVIVIFAGYVWLMIGVVYYRVRTFAYLTSNKVLDDRVQFEAAPSTGQVIKIVVLGSLMIAVILVFAALLYTAVLAAMVGNSLAGVSDFAGFNVVEIAVLAILYLGMFVLAGTLGLVWITQPIIGHFVNSMSVLGAERLDYIRQREADAGADAEGFADALDVGGAI